VTAKQTVHLIDLCRWLKQQRCSAFALVLAVDVADGLDAYANGTHCF